MSRASKPKRQRAIITLTDDDSGDGFTADLTFEPGIAKRTGNSAVVNAALKLARIIVTAKDQLAEPFPPEKKPEPQIIIP